MSNDRWQEVSKPKPCPACGKPDWCAWTPDGEMLKCERTLTPPPGMVLVKPLDRGALFKYRPPAFAEASAGKRDGGTAKCARPVTPKPLASPKAEAEPPRDMEREAEFARDCHDDLSADEDALAYLWRRRGIGCKTASDWGVGVTDIRRDASGAIIGATWTLPILSHLPPRPLIGVKLHRDPPQTGLSKGGWRVRGGAALFPLPEAQSLQPGAEIILCEGELKALTYIEAGIPATSPTTGAAMRWTPDTARRFSGLAVLIDPDDEESNAARDFVSNAARALSHIARSVEVCGIQQESEVTA